MTDHSGELEYRRECWKVAPAPTHGGFTISGPATKKSELATLNMKMQGAEAAQASIKFGMDSVARTHDLVDVKQPNGTMGAVTGAQLLKASPATYKSWIHQTSHSDPGASALLAQASTAAQAYQGLNAFKKQVTGLIGEVNNGTLPKN